MEPADDFLDFILSDDQAVRANVGRLHRGACVDQDDDRPPANQTLDRSGVAQGQHENRQETQLKQKRQKPPELCEQRRRVPVPQNPFPKRREGHGHDASAQFEQIEDDDAQTGSAEDRDQLGQRQPREDHFRNPPRRKTCRMSSSNGVPTSATAYGT